MNISVLVACHTPMEPSTVLALRHLLPVCPYNADVWEWLLQKHGLLARYDKIIMDFRFSFDLHLPQLSTSQMPPNHPSLLQHWAAFDSIIERELDTGRYVGPFTHLLHSLLGEFQTSPMSIIPKSGKPGKFCVIQKISFLYLLWKVRQPCSKLDNCARFVSVLLLTCITRTPNTLWYSP